MVHPVIRHYLPYVNLAIATSALIFQTTVLYPWHEELDTGFRKLKDEQARQLQDYHQLKLKYLEALAQKVDAVAAVATSKTK
ncbi:hypothetical protein CERSUDRAFT_116765 [Gelatoporia subvermispora B]|uniref:Uncharacterized protein n=1 Tax=Ceriporiopsis subvermispora (strain B) TaxID=914234 RepID=M2PFA1_CERS8|nr:hypothetical protein CERSUDRAFT_116765 [Gelatoporia subvermispora B]